MLEAVGSEIAVAPVPVLSPVITLPLVFLL